MNTGKTSTARYAAHPETRQHPLGNLVYRHRAARPATARLKACAVLIAASALIVTASRLTPDASGMGTHVQLGLPACTMVVYAGVPCPTCGMTTAFAHTFRGEWLAAIRAQPAGFVLALLAATAWVMAAGVLATGKVWRLNWYRLPPRRLGLAAIGLVLAAWGFKLIWCVAEGYTPFLLR